MKKLFSALVFLIAGISAMAADITTPIPGKCTAFRPESLYGTILYEKRTEKLASSKDYGQTTINRAKEYWIVYSDRAENPAYVAPGSSTVHTRLDFNEKLWIAKIENGYALVYSEGKTEAWPKISSYAEFKGWVPMSHLLLWDTCPANDTGIYEKAMLCANIDKKLDNGNLGKLFKNPQNLKSFDDLSINFNYYFIMKREGRMVLLATQNTMNGNSYKVLYGWVDENSYVAWNQRSCLEPTWEIEDVEYFAKNGTKVNIYDDVKQTKKASYITFTKKTNADFDPFMYRMSGSTLRYPILDGSTSTLWNCSTFSSTGSGGGAINAGTTETKKEDTILKEKLNELSKIKIAIVIDGTKSMEKYFPAVRDAIKEFTQFFQKSDQVKVGVLIYRDKKDGEYVTESFPMTDPSNPQLAAFLDSGGKYGVKSSSADKSLEEALYYGIDKALDTFGFKPKESNMMFVIGDCGNSQDYPTITKASLNKKLVDKNVTLMGFQVRNDSSSQAYTVFNNNICDLIKESLQARFNALASGVVVKAQLKKNEYEFTNNAASIENSLYVGSHKYVQSGNMDINLLKDHMNRAVITVNTAINHQRGLIVDFANGVLDGTAAENRFGKNSEISGPVLDLAWLEDRIGKEYTKSLSESNTTVSFKGYTAKKDKASDRDYYKTVIFISQQELNTLMIRLSPLYEVAQKKGNDREPYVKAMKALVQGMIPGITDAEMNKMGYDEVMGLVSGLNASTMSLKGRTIAEVSSTQAVNATEYQSIIAKFKRQYLKLQTIQKKPYKFVREFNGAKYYWIPTEDLP